MGGAASFCTQTAVIKRNADLGGGITGAPVTHITSLAITPIWPVSSEVARQLDIASARELKECFHVSDSTTILPDVREGDLLVLDGTEYPIFDVQEWTDRQVPCLCIIVQEVKS